MSSEHTHPAGPTRRMFWLYRPTAPSVRAQSIQVVHSAHASAVRGHRVSLCVQAAHPGVSANEVLRFYGLSPTPTLSLTVLPAGNTAASMGFRAHFAAWAVGGGTVVARSKRYAAEALDWAGGRFELILEAHEVDSLLVQEAGGDPGPMRELEARVVRASRAVLCNCEGTRDLLEQAHRCPPTAVLHNGTHESRIRWPEGPGEGLGYVGSVRGFKDPGILAAAAMALPVALVGADPDEALLEQSAGNLHFEPPLDHWRVPDRLVGFAALALPVGDGLFGRSLTSPLKLWDYFAVGRPVVAADTPAIRAAAGDAFEPYAPGDAADFVRAVKRVLTDPERAAALVARGRARTRTWADRAAELDHFLDQLP